MKFVKILSLFIGILFFFLWVRFISYIEITKAIIGFILAIIVGFFAYKKLKSFFK